MNDPIDRVNAIIINKADTHIEDLTNIIVDIVVGIKEDDVWADDWCPVCHEHPSHDHGGKDCALKKAINFVDHIKK